MLVLLSGISKKTIENYCSNPVALSVLFPYFPRSTFPLWFFLSYHSSSQEQLAGLQIQRGSRYDTMRQQVRWRSRFSKAASLWGCRFGEISVLAGSAAQQVLWGSWCMLPASPGVSPHLCDSTRAMDTANICRSRLIKNCTYSPSEKSLILKHQVPLVACCRGFNRQMQLFTSLAERRSLNYDWMPQLKRWLYKYSLY